LLWCRPLNGHRTLPDNNAPQNTQQRNSPQESFFVSSPKIELPKGGGAIKGIGEKFANNPVSGTGSMSIPIATSPGRGGFAPQLSLSYDSGAGNSPFGFGWSLSLPRISRKTDKGLPRYIDSEESDVFMLSGAEDLVPLLNQDGSRFVDGDTHAAYTIHRYRPRIEGLFARIERWTEKATGDAHWRSLSKDNVLTIYGKDPNSRIADPANPQHIFSWLICETRDDEGNGLLYRYKEEDGVGVSLNDLCEKNRGELTGLGRTANRYLKHIYYGNSTTLLEQGKRALFLSEQMLENTEWLFEVVFDYGEHDQSKPRPDDAGNWLYRNDPFSSYRAGFEVRTTRLCQRVLMFHHFAVEQDVRNNCLVRSTDLTYLHQQQPQDLRDSIYSFLKAASQAGYKRKADDENSDYIKRSMPPVEFSYSEPIVQQLVEEVDPDSLENLPIGVDGSNYRWTDLHGEGIPGMLTEQGGSWFYKRNLSPINLQDVNTDPQGDLLTRNNAAPIGQKVEFSPLEKVMLKPNIALAVGAQLMDLAGNGEPDLVVMEGPAPGFYEHQDQQAWKNFQPFQSRLNRNMQDPNLKFIDLDGDGHADVLITEEHAFIWHASLKEQGFAPANRVNQVLDEEKGPRLVFANASESIYLSDFSGDGLTDIVRIRNGEVCYWPNLGYCQFGAKVNMANAPWFDTPDLFDHRRIRTADIDGSGTIDLIYLHADGVRLYFNQSGNSWSNAKQLALFPQVNNLDNIQTADLLGNGTACLVWSSPLPDKATRPMRYVNLMGQQKPHLLIKTINNLGAETRVSYVPSTKFYLQDKRDGKPWITKLPFPVHVVEKVTVTDKWKKTKFSTRYSYHHGYFDGIEREFRGFGRVEQVDVETYGEFAAGNSNSPFITADKTLYQPPIKTVSWFHTGAALDREPILAHFKKEYFKPNGDFDEKPLPEPTLQHTSLNSQEWREALRACKGLPLRQEVYELDVDALAQGRQTPVRLFSTSLNNCDIQMLQAQAENRHAVFLVTESEAISYQYDLDLRSEIQLADPRIAHTLNLNIDQYGNVLQSVAAVYPRIREHQDESLPLGAQDLINRVQGDRHLVYNETHFTNDVDGFAEPDEQPLLASDINNYRLRVPCEVSTFEVTGISPSGFYFELEELKQLRLSQKYQLQGLEPLELAYHELPNHEVFEKRNVEQVRMLFFKPDLQEPLELGKLNALGLPFETYKLALTEPLLALIFGNKLTADVRLKLDNANQSGYLSGADLSVRFPDDNTNGQYWIRSGIAGYSEIAGFSEDAKDHFFLAEKYSDPFGSISEVNYDPRDLFIQSSSDAFGNTVSIEQFDYRLLAPLLTKDINDNLSEVMFDTLGLPAAVAVKGKGDEADNLNGFTQDLLDLDLDIRVHFFEQSFSDQAARSLLGNASARHIYDFGEVRLADGSLSYGHRPASAAAIMRETHVAKLKDNQSTRLQLAFEYSDGGGNVLVNKAQAEPEIQGGSIRWIVSGKTILNNKGKPVKQYEPYFSDVHTYTEAIEVGVTPVIYYDAADRVIRTESPDGTVSRAEFTPWHVHSFDANDTAFNSLVKNQSDWYQRRTNPAHAKFSDYNSPQNQQAAKQTEVHANTPAQVFLDSLGRDVISVEHNKFIDSAQQLQDEKYVTFTQLDAEGKPLWIRDARGNLVMQYISPPLPNHQPLAQVLETVSGFVPCYGIAGNLLFQHSMDGGDRWMLSDAAGQPFIAWDQNGINEADLEQRRYQTHYDVLRRPLQQRLYINDGPALVIERLEYGEGQIAAKLNNLCGQLIRHYDSSGLMHNVKFDFTGNLLEAKRQFAAFSTQSLIDWPDNPLADMLDQSYSQNTLYDGLGRMVEHRNWYLADREPAIYKPQYNKRGLLISESLTVRGQVTQAIKNIEFDAKGQRTRIEYGNDTTTRYRYDEETFRLKQLRTTKTSPGDPLPSLPSNLLNENVLQNLYYTYDPVGNITEIRDDAYEPVFFRNQEVEPKSRYRYDSLYRLIAASGRENINAPATAPKAGKLAEMLQKEFGSSEKALRNYTQHYHYDSVGNIKQMEHKAVAGSWTRHYDYFDDSNRLNKTWQGGDEDNAIFYHYDTHGSLLNLDRVPDDYRLQWDANDMIEQINLGGGGEAFYRYGADKERSRKRIVQDNVVEERLYLGGMEHYRRWENNNPDPVAEIETYHLFDGEQRLLMVEDVLSTDNRNLDEGVLLFRYQYSNHLGSVGLEVDDDGNIIFYEEYHPYGTTAFSASGSGVRATRKRYRYTGMERDEESGLSYHSARYYLPWLGRWGGVDPAGLAGGENLFMYTTGNPVNLVDEDGNSPSKPKVGFFRRLANSTKVHVIEKFVGTAINIGQGKIVELGDNRSNDASKLVKAANKEGNLPKPKSAAGSSNPNPKRGKGGKVFWDRSKVAAGLPKKPPISIAPLSKELDVKKARDASKALGGLSKTSKLGTSLRFVSKILGAPDATDVFTMGLSHIMSLTERKELLKDNRFVGGFRTGLAASLLKKDKNFVNNWLADHSGEMYSEIFLGAAKGELGSAANEGLVAGFLYGEYLSSGMRAKYSETAREGISGSVGEADFVLLAGFNLGGTVTEMFSKAAKHAAKEAAENRAIKIQDDFSTGTGLIGKIGQW
jgi:RHS repeat-associated protein